MWVFPHTYIMEIRIEISPAEHHRLTEIKQRHGLSWRGMLIIAERTLLNIEVTEDPKNG